MPRKLTDDSVMDSETISIEEFAQILGVSRGTIYTLQRDKASEFPAPIPLGLRTKRYRKDEALAYAKYGCRWRAMQALRG